MKRVLVALLAISMAAGVLTGCGSKGSEKTFTVGFDAEFPPYGYRDDSGEYVGFDLDLAAEVCKRQGWELVKQPIAVSAMRRHGFGKYCVSRKSL